MEPGAVFTLPKASSGINRTLYFYEGEAISLAGEPVTRYHAVEVESEADLVIENGNHRSRLLLLQGKPIGEPVIQYGPFVMNTKEEINQTFEDYHRTKFGGWPWPNYEQVHAREKGRFAKHSDGRLEEKS
jgi:redox-sensitive bicupin YhaK (pirin superfamily)